VAPRPGPDVPGGIEAVMPNPASCMQPRPYSYLPAFNMAVYWCCPRRYVRKILSACVHPRRLAAAAAVVPGRTQYKQGAVRLPHLDDLQEKMGFTRNPGMYPVDIVLDGEFHETGLPPSSVTGTAFDEPSSGPPRRARSVWSV
jgi:hypothetical protein